MASIRTHTARDWGLDSPREHDWARDGLCRDDPDRWSSDAVPVIAEVRHVCLKHCPVLLQCQADAASVGPDLRRLTTWGGVRYNQAGTAADRQPLAATCPRCPPVHQAVLVRTCRRCGDTFDTDRNNRQYCTAECRRKSDRERDRAKWRRRKEMAWTT